VLLVSAESLWTLRDWNGFAGAASSSEPPLNRERRYIRGSLPGRRSRRVAALSRGQHAIRRHRTGAFSRRGSASLVPRRLSGEVLKRASDQIVFIQRQRSQARDDDGKPQPLCFLVAEQLVRVEFQLGPSPIERRVSQSDGNGVHQCREWHFALPKEQFAPKSNLRRQICARLPDLSSPAIGESQELAKANGPLMPGVECTDQPAVNGGSGNKHGVP
jgi:hypothetical protein